MGVKHSGKGVKHPTEPRQNSPGDSETQMCGLPWLVRIRMVLIVTGPDPQGWCSVDLSRGRR